MHDIEIRGGRTRLTALTNSHAEALEQSTAMASRMTENIRGTTAQSAITLEHASSGRSLVASGSEAVSGLVEAVERLELVLGELTRTSGVVEKIRDCSWQIGRLVRESRVLSTNASIEAARAGPAGRGFAVIARSMQELSCFSGELAEEITAAVDQGVTALQHAAELVEAHLEESHRRAHTAQDALLTLSDKMDEIAHSSERILDSSRAGLADLEHFQEVLSKRSEALSYKAARLFEQERGACIRELSPLEVAPRLAQLHVIDVRRPEEFNNELGHIEGAELCTIGRPLERWLAQLDPERPILFVCRSGGRSARAAQLAILQGLRQVFNLRGGMLAWRAAALPSSREAA